MWLQSVDCFHGINDFIKLGGTWYPFCSECKMVVEVEPPEAPESPNSDTAPSEPETEAQASPKIPHHTDLGSLLERDGG